MCARIAAVAADAVLCLAVYVALRRAGPGPWFSLAMTGRLALAAAIAVAVGLIPGVPAGARAAAVISVFCISALVLRAVPEELMSAAQRARGWVGRR